MPRHPTRLRTRTWFLSALQVRGSVIQAVLPRCLLCGGVGLLVSALYAWGYLTPWPILGSLIPDLVLGLLLVFRTNTAYERFWEGRKAWGAIINTARNLGRQILVLVKESNPQDHKEKIRALRLLAAFTVALKLHLRGQAVNEEIEALVPPNYYYLLKEAQHPPLAIALWLEDYLKRQCEYGHLNVYQMTLMSSTLGKLVDEVGSCERIQKTPIPMAYAIHLRQLLLLYCLLLPMRVVKDLTWWTGPAEALMSFVVLGVEEIGNEIEDPFGTDANDLPLDSLCNTMHRNMEDLVQLAITSQVAGHDDSTIVIDTYELPRSSV